MWRPEIEFLGLLENMNHIIWFLLQLKISAFEGGKHMSHVIWGNHMSHMWHDAYACWVTSFDLFFCSSRIYLHVKEHRRFHCSIFILNLNPFLTKAVLSLYEAIDVRHGRTSAPSGGLLVPKLICTEVNEIFQNLCRSSCAEVDSCRSSITWFQKYRNYLLMELHRNYWWNYTGITFGWWWSSAWLLV